MNKLSLLLIVLASLLSIDVLGQTTVYNALNGQIVLTSSEYVNYLSKQYNIYTSSNSQVVLDIDYNIEPNYDYIYVYECDDNFNKLNLIATLHGDSNINIKTTNTNGRVVIVFISDEGVCGSDGGPDAGYIINWNGVDSNSISSAPIRVPVNSTSPIYYNNTGLLVGSESSPASSFTYFGGVNPCFDFKNKCNGSTQRFEIGLASANGAYAHFAKPGDVVFRKLGGVTGNACHNMLFYMGNDNNDGYNYITFGDFTNGRTLSVFNNGKVAIGTTVYSSSAILTVDGGIVATEIKVEAQIADYVFEDNYNLRSLGEVETFIKTNKHLPDIPSAAQMETDGVNLAEMNKLLLQKIEELTLYVIEKEKKILELEGKKGALEKRVEKIETLIEANF